MFAVGKKRHEYGGEPGFTLPELLATLVVLGILAAIAFAVMLGILEQRRVDAATRQLVSDLRLAHTSATNQLTDWRVVYSAGSPDYEIQRLARPCNEGCAAPVVEEIFHKSLPDGTEIKSASNIAPGGASAAVELNSDGTGRAFYGVSTTIIVSSTDGEPSHRIGFSAATSRVKVD